MLIKMKGLPDAFSPPDATLGAVVSGVRREAGRSRRVVSEILLDGELLTAEREALEEARPASDFSRLEVELTSPEDLVGRVSGGLIETLKALEGQCRGAALDIRAGAPPRTAILPLAEGLSFVMGAHQDCLKVLAAFSSAPPAPSAAAAALEGVLREVLSALEDGDGVRVGDALEHEVSPVLLLLQGELSGWMDAARGGSSAKEGGASAS